MGDNGKGIKFPLITLCNYDFVSTNEILSDCREKYSNYFPALQNCLQSWKFDLENFNNSLDYNVSSIISKTTLRFGTREEINLKNVSNVIWKPVFHAQYGLCFLFDLCNVKKYRYVNVHSENGRPSVKMFFNENAWSWTLVLLHTDYDLPDALKLHPYFYARSDVKENVYVELKKRIIYRY